MKYIVNVVIDVRSRLEKPLVRAADFAGLLMVAQSMTDALVGSLEPFTAGELVFPPTSQSPPMLVLTKQCTLRDIQTLLDDLPHTHDHP